MDELPFSLDLLQFLFEHRSAALTRFFQVATFFGEVDGYILIVTLVYVAYDKGIAFRLAALVLVTMCLNHILKVLIGNPRPFVTQGTIAEKWAVSADKLQELATEYSTPSGHAMSTAAFYSYLCASIRKRFVLVIAIPAIFLIGLSRPYLGVHYLEDVILGWAIGFLVVLIAIRYAERIGKVWNARSHREQIIIVVASSVAVWLVTLVVNGWIISTLSVTFIGYLGFLSGIVIAYPLEIKFIDFDPKSSTLLHKALRYTLSVCAVIAALMILDTLFARLSGDFTLLGHVLRYIRYIAAGIVGMYFAPLMFTNLGLAKSTMLPVKRIAPVGG